MLEFGLKSIVSSRNILTVTDIWSGFPARLRHSLDRAFLYCPSMNGKNGVLSVILHGSQEDEDWQLCDDCQREFFLKCGPIYEDTWDP